MASADSANSADKSGGTAGPQSPDAIEREMEETRIRLAATIDELVSRGVQLARFEGMEQDHRGVWTTPNGDRVAWFTDPDGNVLSLTQFR